MKLYIAFITVGGLRARQAGGRIILHDTAMPVSADDMKRIEDEIEQRTGTDAAFITFMHQLED